MKNVYLIVTDLHYAVNKEHRRNYMGEVMNILNQIDELRQRYVDDGYSVHLIFLGDIIDGSQTQTEHALRCYTLFRFYTALFSSTSTVLGNHEANNTTSNPFWFLVSELRDPALCKLSKPLQPQGVESTIDVPETLTDGDVTFYFNHYGVPTKVPERDGVAIGLFHQNVGSSDICKMWGTFVDVEEAAFVRAYNHSFFGHMHLANGKYFLDNEHNCIGEWLGSCVGTNVDEVEQLPEACNIPAVVVVDGKFERVEDNAIKRTPANVAIDYEKLRLTRAANELAASVKDMIPKSYRDDTLFKRVAAAAEDLKLGPLVQILNQSTENVLDDYKRELRQQLLEDDEDGQ